MDPSFTEGLSCPGHRTGSAGRTRGAEPLPTELEARRRTVLHRGAQRRPRRQPRTARLGRGWPRWCSRTRRGSGASRKVRASPAMSTSLAAEADVPLNRSLQSCVARAVVRRAARVARCVRVDTARRVLRARDGPVTTGRLAFPLHGGGARWLPGWCPWHGLCSRSDSLAAPGGSRDEGAGSEPAPAAHRAPDRSRDLAWRGAAWHVRGRALESDGLSPECPPLPVQPNLRVPIRGG